MSKTIIQIGKQAREASRSYSQSSTNKKNAVLKTIASLIRINEKAILRENRKDVLKQGENHPLSDRLMLDAKRLKDIRESLLAVTKLPDPVGEVIERKSRLILFQL